VVARGRAPSQQFPAYGEKISAWKEAKEAETLAWSQMRKSLIPVKKSSVGTALAGLWPVATAWDEGFGSRFGRPRRVFHG
jgi:hypothetical protein